MLEFTIMFGITLDGTNIHTIVLCLLIVGIAVYGYLEIKRLKVSVASLEKAVYLKVPYPPPQKRVNVPSPPSLQEIQMETYTMPTAPQTFLPNQPEAQPNQLEEQPNQLEAQPNQLEEQPNQLEAQPKQTESSLETELSTLMNSEEEFDSYDLNYSHETASLEESPLVSESDIKEIKLSNNLESEDTELSEYSQKTVSELKAILTEMNQPVSGNKTKLIKRIKEHTIVNKV